MQVEVVFCDVVGAKVCSFRVPFNKYSETLKRYSEENENIFIQTMRFACAGDNVDYRFDQVKDAIDNLVNGELTVNRISKNDFFYITIFFRDASDVHREMLLWLSTLPMEIRCKIMFGTWAREGVFFSNIVNQVADHDRTRWVHSQKILLTGRTEEKLESIFDFLQ